MRIVVFSLVNDWDLGPRLAERGHQLLAWVRPEWKRPPKGNTLGRRLRRLAKIVLSRDGPPTTITPRQDVYEWLVKHEINMIECSDINSIEFVRFLESLDPDLVLVAIYPQILRAQVLRVPRRGVINYHPSSLPRYAGPQPIFWMLKNGEEEAGITIHEMVEKLDGGPILAQESLKISPEENAGQILQRLNHRAAQLLAVTVDAIEKGQVEARPQNLAERTYYRRSGKKDRTLDWNAPAYEIANLLRAIQPWDALTGRLNGRTITITEVSTCETPNGRAEPGEILSKRGGSLLVQTGRGGLCIHRYEIAPFRGWLNRLAQICVPWVGERFAPRADDEKSRP